MSIADGPVSRMTEVTGARNQKELSETLDISPSSVSLCIKTGQIAPSLLLKLLTERKVNPAWILTGEEPKYLLPSAEEEDAFETALSIVLTNKQRLLKHIESEILVKEVLYRVSLGNRGRI